jgi:hypothetical protein
MIEIDPNVLMSNHFNMSKQQTVGDGNKVALYNEVKVFLKPVDLGDCVIQAECGYDIFTFDFYRVGRQISLRVNVPLRTFTKINVNTVQIVPTNFIFIHQYLMNHQTCGSC